MKKNRLFILLITLLMSLSFILPACFVAPDSPSDSVNGGQTSEPIDNRVPDAVNPTDDITDHKITENVLHEIDVNFTTPVGVFTANNTTEYKIAPKHGYSIAANHIAKHVEGATGAKMQVIESDDEPTVDVNEGKYIVMGDAATMEEYAIIMPSKDELKSAGYYIQTRGDDVFIGFYSAHGAQLAAIAFLREVVGYDMISDDMVIYEKDGSVLPQMTIKERPDYEFRMPDNKLTASEKYGMGFTTVNTMLITSSGDNVHNMYDFFTPEEFVEHSDWHSDGAVWGTGGNRIGQICFTARGNKASYTEFVNFFAEKLEAYIESSSEDIVNMRISPNDVALNNSVAVCKCDACQKSVDYYGTIGGAMLAFANDVSTVIDEYMAENHPDRKFNIVLLAYGAGIQAPVARLANGQYDLDENGKGKPVTRYEFDENGRWSPVKDAEGNEVKLVFGKNVGCEFAPSAASWSHTFYEEENNRYSSALEAWSGIAHTLYIWAYEVNFPSFFYPYNNYDILVENLRYFKSYGANYLFPHGCDWQNANCPGFMKFRTYVNSKAMFDVNVDYTELRAKFFKYYFGDAETYMSTLLDMIQLNLKDKESVTGSGIQSEKYASTEVWSHEILVQFMGLIEKSYEAVEKYKTEDSELYEVLKKHILIESQFPRIAICSLYPLEYSPETIKAMRKSFLEDFYALQNTTHKEHTTNKINDLVADWELD